MCRDMISISHTGHSESQLPTLLVVSVASLLTVLTSIQFIILEECPRDQMAEPTSAAIMRYPLVDKTTTVLEEKRKSAIPKKTQQDTNGI